MTDDERLERLAEIVMGELADPHPGLWWLSFIDPTKPQGERFLGVVVVHADGPTLAVQRASELGVNPGGEVAIIPLPPGFEVLPEARDRLLDRATAAMLQR